MKILSKYPVLIIVLLYIVANMFMFVNNGWYWDDWCLSTPEGITSICTGVGQPFMIPIHSFLINLTKYPALLYHITTGVFEILGIIIFYKCLSLLGVKRSHAFLLTLFFGLLPYNQAKITMACYMYTIGFLLFLFAVLIFLYFIRKNNLLLRLISLIFFFCSFLFLPSTLVLALAFFLLIAIIHQKSDIEFSFIYFKLILRKLFTWIDFMLLPFVFWVFRAIYLKPTGEYASLGYREFSLISFLSTPLNLIFTFIQNFLGLASIVDPIKTSTLYSLLFLIIFLLLIIKSSKYRIEPITIGKLMLLIGLYLFMAGAFAYTLLGYLPSFNGFNSRHQILLKFGSPFILIYIINLIQNGKIQKIFIIITVSSFMVYNISNQLQYQKSWFKQIALEKAFAQEKLFKEEVNIIIFDNTKNYNEYEIPYAFYCYTGILNKSFGNQTRFAIDSEQLSLLRTYNLFDFVKLPYNNMQDCKNVTTFSYYFIIDSGSSLLSNINCIKMIYDYCFNFAKFEYSLSTILSYKMLSYNNS